MKQYEKSIIALVLAGALFLIVTPFSMSVNAQVKAKIVKPYSPSIVRGKIERGGDKKIYPASYVRVTLAPESKRTKRITAYTGSDGMFYFRNVAKGGYILEVWNTEGKAIKKYSVRADREFVDIAPIKLD
jgi:hypothetical protein